jgi:predicted permease
MSSLLQDIRYTIRTLLRSPGFTLVAVLTLALGIGANTAIFTLVHATILKPLPFRDPSRLIAAWDLYGPTNLQVGVSPAEFTVWDQQTDLFESTGWYRYVSKDLNLSAPGIDPFVAHSTFISSQFLPLLGVSPAIGKLPNEPNELLLSNALWRTRFNADPAIAGKFIRLNDQAFTIAGVLPQSFKYPDFAELFLPPGLLLGDEATNPIRHAMGFVARLRPGVGEQQAEARLEAVAKRLAAEHPKTSTGWGVRVAGLQADLTAKQRTPLLLLLGAVALVLLIACANVANLLLARASGRAKEIAVRTALGAGAWRIVRQLLTESVLLSLVGGGTGVLIGRWSVDVFRQAETPAPQSDFAVLAFALAISVFTGILFGIAPAMHAIDRDADSGMKAMRRTSSVRSALVIGEFALALMLVTGAGILLRSFVRLMDVNPGFSTHGLLTMRLAVPDQSDALFRRIEARVRQLPGVEMFASTNALPLTMGHGNAGRFNVPGSPLIQPDSLPYAQTWFVSPGYLGALQIPLHSGRGFDEHDLTGDAVIINESMARRFWPNRDPVGEKFITGPWGPKPTWSTIVGVARDVKQIALDAEPPLDIYFPALYPASIVVKTAGDPMSLAPAVRAIIREINPALPVSEVRSMDRVLDESAQSRRWMLALLASFAALALVLALVGIYGVMAWSVAQRTREIGVRMALGARSGHVLASVMSHGLKLSVAGMLIGIAGALALRRYLATLVFDVSTADPLVYGAVALLMLAAGLLACYLPARRASRVDPLVALRNE